MIDLLLLIASWVVVGTLVISTIEQEEHTRCVWNYRPMCQPLGILIWPIALVYYTYRRVNNG